MAMQQEAAFSAAAPAERPRTGERSLFSPLIDFLCLGGGSLFVLAALGLTVPAETGRPVLLLLGPALAHVINHPHFAHSYQIFYRDFRAKVRGEGYGRELQIRYIVAGIVVPVALALACAGAVASGDPYVLGLGGNIMVFFVGWHYVKQGYGILMLDAALKKRFFDAFEKKVFLVNAYATWVCNWMVANMLVRESDTWGLKAYTIAIPAPILYLSMALAAATLLASAFVLVRKGVIRRQPLPFNGVVAYIAALYVWLFASIHPVISPLVPAFHSLQYLVVVWRYKLNRERGRPDARTTPLKGRLGALLPKLGGLRILSFLGLGIVVGYLGFWGVPKFLNAVVPYDTAAFGPTMFLFIFWIFINVHHYFLDNVMWRRGNPEVQKHMFA
jgi:hypothetical protein